MTHVGRWGGGKDASQFMGVVEERNGCCGREEVEEREAGVPAKRVENHRFQKGRQGLHGYVE